MDVIQFLSFYHIVNTGSFYRASKCVHRSPSAISHQIKKLEQDFKIKLFERQGKKVKLTQEGGILFDIISKFINDLENVKRIFADLQCGHTGNLSIAIARGLMNHWFSDVITMFTDKVSGIKFKLFTCHILQLQEMVLNSEAAFGIGPAHQLISQRLNLISWKSFERLLLVKKGHPLCKKKRIEISDIAEYPLILIGMGHTRKAVEEVFIQNNLSYEIIMELDTEAIIKKFVRSGMGVTILSSLAVDDYDKKVFSVFDVSHLFGKMEYGIYYRKGAYISNAMHQFVKFFAPEIVDQLP